MIACGGFLWFLVSVSPFLTTRATTAIHGTTTGTRNATTTHTIIDHSIGSTRESTTSTTTTATARTGNGTSRCSSRSSSSLLGVVSGSTHNVETTGGRVGQDDLARIAWKIGTGGTRWTTDGRRIPGGRTSPGRVPGGTVSTGGDIFTRTTDTSRQDNRLIGFIAGHINPLTWWVLK